MNTNYKIAIFEKNKDVRYEFRDSRNDALDFAKSLISKDIFMTKVFEPDAVTSFVQFKEN